MVFAEVLSDIFFFVVVFCVFVTNLLPRKRGDKKMLVNGCLPMVSSNTQAKESANKPPPQQLPSYTKKDWFFVLTNYRRTKVYDDELLNNKNLFYLYVVHKIPFDVNVLKLIPEKFKFKRSIECIETWNTYLREGKISGNISNLFLDGQSIMLEKFFSVYDFNKDRATKYKLDADAVDIIYWILHPEIWNNFELVSSGFPVPGMLSYELFKNNKQQCTLQLTDSFNNQRVVEMSDFIPYGENGARTVIVDEHNCTLEEVKAMNPRPDVIVIDANPYGLSEQFLEFTYKLAYVLCKRKLIIIKDAHRIEWIKQILQVKNIAVTQVPMKVGKQRF